ncbi:MAG: CDP-diacylglycerol--serine O-phosphatidyltransferase [Bacilli bacterium]|jgi:CDP-diacylglycerol--serine O-phosphatidyltransferase|nr:CDP-diacylglycerol--serine O-phosphatidyltransferase [Bacilli bacterium]
MIGIYNYTVLFTLFGTITGLISITEAMSGNLEIALLGLLVCGFFDMFDGTIARTKKNRTEFEIQYGIQLDSLSDVVCFGALPTIIAFQITKPLGLWQSLTILYMVASISRLAYFNVEEAMRREKENGRRKTYTGLPVTTAAIIFPILYLFSFWIPNFFPVFYLTGVLITACFHISKIKVPHLEKKGLIICLIIGIVLLSLISFLLFLA